MKHNVTFVTGLWNIGRDDLEAFKRPFDNYLICFDLLLGLDINLVVYVPDELKEFVEQRRSLDNTKIIIRNNQDFKTWFNFYDKVNQLRTDPNWYNQAGWLAESPQAKLELYAPIQLSKMFMVNDASIFDPFGTEYFFWIDAGLANTVGVTDLANLNRITGYMQDKQGKMLFLSYPYESNTEIHGFERTKLAEYCDTDFVRYVPRGGFWGGPKSIINFINSYYWQYLNQAFESGYLGVDESFFCILCHRHSEITHRFEISGNGLVYPFFQQLVNYDEVTARPAPVVINKPLDQVKTALYILTYNSPEQLEALLFSFKITDKDFLTKPQLILVNNSTNLSTTEEYQRLCDQYNIEHIKKDNIGVCGGRQFVAEHFSTSDYDYYIFFEDDMFLFPPADLHCGEQKPVYTDRLYKKSLEIIHQGQYDYLKLSYSEFFGTNRKQWAWCNINDSLAEKYYPGMDRSIRNQSTAPDTLCTTTKFHQGLQYYEGEFHYCNWPLWFTKSGNYKLFLENPLQHPFEQTWMAMSFAMIKVGKINPACLALSPINHHRFAHYSAKERKEC